MYDNTTNTHNIQEIPQWLNRRISELSERSGVSRPTIYKYFRGEDVIPACRAGIERAMEEMKPAPAQA